MALLEPYERYAEFYDRIGQRQFGRRLASVILSDGGFDLSSESVVADLACGTGAAALQFASAGCRVIGVDRSQPMLDRAARNAAAADLSIAWLRQDLRELALPKPVDLTTCVYDSLNYILERDDLAEILRRVRGSLKPGGAFVFDLNSRRRLAEAWADETFVAADEPDLFVIYRSTWNEETSRSPLRLTAFLKSRENQAWERFDEEHVERGWLISEIEELLTDAGFASIDVRDFNVRFDGMGGPGTEASNRLLFIARTCP